jgi:hypothetical protein
MAIEEPVDEMKVAGPATPRTDCKLAGHVRVGARSKGRHFLVTDVNPFNSFLSTHRLSDSIERIADYSIDSLDAGRSEGRYQVFGYSRHSFFPPIVSPSPCSDSSHNSLRFDAGAKSGKSSKCPRFFAGRRQIGRFDCGGY